jgi:hypothetical protein
MLCGEHGESFDDPSLHHDLESGSLLSLLGIREVPEPRSSMSRPSSLTPREERLPTEVQLRVWSHAVPDPRGVGNAILAIVNDDLSSSRRRSSPFPVPAISVSHFPYRNANPIVVNPPSHSTLTSSHTIVPGVKTSRGSA